MTYTKIAGRIPYSSIFPVWRTGGRRRMIRKNTAFYTSVFHCYAAVFFLIAECPSCLILDEASDETPVRVQGGIPTPFPRAARERL